MKAIGALNACGPDMIRPGGVTASTSGAIRTILQGMPSTTRHALIFLMVMMMVVMMIMMIRAKFNGMR